MKIRDIMVYLSDTAMVLGLYLKKNNFSKKTLAKPLYIVYTELCCDMIALKREVATF